MDVEDGEVLIPPTHVAKSYCECLRNMPIHTNTRLYDLLYQNEGILSLTLYCRTAASEAQHVEVKCKVFWRNKGESVRDNTTLSPEFVRTNAEPGLQDYFKSLRERGFANMKFKVVGRLLPPKGVVMELIVSQTGEAGTGGAGTGTGGAGTGGAKQKSAPTSPSPPAKRVCAGMDNLSSLAAAAAVASPLLSPVTERRYDGGAGPSGEGPDVPAAASASARALFAPAPFDPSAPPSAQSVPLFAVRDAATLLRKHMLESLRFRLREPAKRQREMREELVKAIEGARAARAALLASVPALTDPTADAGFVREVRDVRAMLLSELQLPSFSFTPSMLDAAFEKQTDASRQRSAWAFNILRSKRITALYNTVVDQRYEEVRTGLLDYEDEARTIDRLRGELLDAPAQKAIRKAIPALVRATIGLAEEGIHMVAAPAMLVSDVSQALQRRSASSASSASSFSVEDALVDAAGPTQGDFEDAVALLVDSLRSVGVLGDAEMGVGAFKLLVDFTAECSSPLSRSLANVGKKLEECVDLLKITRPSHIASIGPLGLAEKLKAALSTGVDMLSKIPELCDDEARHFNRITLTWCDMIDGCRDKLSGYRQNITAQIAAAKSEEAKWLQPHGEFVWNAGMSVAEFERAYLKVDEFKMKESVSILSFNLYELAGVAKTAPLDALSSALRAKERAFHVSGDQHMLKKIREAKIPLLELRDIYDDLGDESFYDWFLAHYPNRAVKLSYSTFI